MPVRVIQDFLPQSYVDEIHNTFLGTSFPWYYHCETSSHVYDDKNTIDTFQFVHSFYRDNSARSSYYNLVSPILLFLSKETGDDYASRLIRIKSNLLLKSQTPKESYHSAHRDDPIFDTETFLYYVNDSDGDTIIFDDTDKSNLIVSTRNTPKAGSGILFDSTILHSSSSPIINDTRMVINFVFHKKVV
jgi:hypothetical protein